MPVPEAVATVAPITLAISGRVKSDNKRMRQREEVPVAAALGPKRPYCTYAHKTDRVPAGAVGQSRAAKK